MVKIETSKLMMRPSVDAKQARQIAANVGGVSRVVSDSVKKEAVVEMIKAIAKAILAIGVIAVGIVTGHVYLSVIGAGMLYLSMGDAGKAFDSITNAKVKVKARDALLVDAVERSVASSKQARVDSESDSE